MATGRSPSQLEDYSSFTIPLILDRIGGVIYEAAFVVIGSLFLFPMLLLILWSIKGQGNVYAAPFSLPDAIHYENFVMAWESGLGQNFLNTFFVVVTSLILIVALSLLAAYALTIFDFPTKHVTLIFIIAGLMIPIQVLAVPIFWMMSWLNLVNSFLSLILIYVSFSMPFSIFLMYQYISDVPASYQEAAQIDGCSRFEALLHIYFPMSIPAIASVLVFQFVWLWNEFLFVSILINNEEKQTLAPAILNFSGTYVTEFHVMFAGILIAVAPSVIVFLLFQDQFIEGISSRAE